MKNKQFFHLFITTSQLPNEFHLGCHKWYITETQNVWVEKLQWKCNCIWTCWKTNDFFPYNVERYKGLFASDKYCIPKVGRNAVWVRKRDSWMIQGLLFSFNWQIFASNRQLSNMWETGYFLPSNVRQSLFVSGPATGDFVILKSGLCWRLATHDCL